MPAFGRQSLERGQQAMLLPPIVPWLKLIQLRSQNLLGSTELYVVSF